jgi:hypothetical protein
MILNPIRAVRCWRFNRRIERNLAARKQARREGRVYVSGHLRRLT